MQCFLMCLVIFFTTYDSLPLKNHLLHSLKTRLNVHFCGGDFLCLFKVPGVLLFWDRHPLNLQPVVPWTRQATSLGYRITLCLCLRDVSFFFYSPRPSWQVLLGVRSGIVVFLRFPFRIPAFQGESSVRLALALFCPLCPNFLRLSNDLSTDGASVFCLGWFLFSLK